MSLADRPRPPRGAAWIALALLAALSLLGCGRYGPPRRAPQYLEGYVPPAAASGTEASSEAESAPPEEEGGIVEEEVPQP